MSSGKNERIVTRRRWLLVYFASEEINAELSRVEGAGGKILRPKLDIGEFGFIALIQDTEGNMIGLRSMK